MQAVPLYLSLAIANEKTAGKCDFNPPRLWEKSNLLKSNRVYDKIPKSDKY